ncbi:MAG: cytochrome c biogenesis protein CcsA [Verrucomicrobia bacterium]|nr:cytochrome c biogenesis protein CcsA [Verrucomicrobiota bacterium]
MDRWFLIAATALAAIGGGWGMVSVHRGQRSRVTVVWMLFVLVCQFGFLSLRGQVRGSCPLHDPGEILAYLAWAVTIFYLVVGSAYRLSLLGVFSAPLVVVLQLGALGFVAVEAPPHRIPETSAFHALHSSAAVLAYGALGLAAISGVMFLTLNHQLKEQVLRSGLFRNMPPAHSLLVSLERMLWVGTGLLTLGVLAGVFMGPAEHSPGHFFAAIAVWTAYVGLLVFKTFRGMTGRKLALASVAIFVVSLLLFFSV